MSTSTPNSYDRALPHLRSLQRHFAELPTLRANASADLHNLVFQRDYRIVPATSRGMSA